MGLIVAPAKISLLIYQGATFRKRLTWKSGPTISEAKLVDLTGCVARAAIRENYDDPAALLDMTTENGRIVLDGAAGTIDLELAAETTAGLPYLKDGALWDLEIEWPDGDVCRLFQGVVRISREVTHD